MISTRQALIDGFKKFGLSQAEAEIAAAGNKNNPANRNSNGMTRDPATPGRTLDTGMIQEFEQVCPRTFIEWIDSPRPCSPSGVSVSSAEFDEKFLGQVKF